MANIPPDVLKAREGFSHFKMPDGSIHKIRNKYLLTFAVEAFLNKEPLSKGAYIIKHCVATSSGAGRITELLAMIDGD
jgi:hypothetical protein